MSEEDKGGVKFWLPIIVAILIPFLVNAGGMVWWASKTSAELREVVKDVDSVQGAVVDLNNDLTLQKLTTATITQQLSSITTGLRDMRGDMKQLEQLMREILNRDRAPL